jgi:hypothetical protein
MLWEPQASSTALAARASPPGGDSGASFVGMTHSGLPSLQAMIEDSTDEFYMASSGGGSSSLLVSQRLSTGASPSPTATTRWLEDAPATQTMMTVPPRAATQ